MSRPPLDADWFAHRVIRDAMNEATGAYWRRRADTFRGCQTRPEDYVGSTTEEHQAARRRRILMIVENCEHRATISDLTEVEEELIHDEFDRCAAVHRYMRHADRAVTLFDLRALWRDAQQASRLDVQLARHFDDTAKRIKADAAVDHAEALSAARTLPLAKAGAA